MRKIFIAAFALALSGCGASPEEKKLEELEAAQTEIRGNQALCREELDRKLLASAEQSKIEWDQAAAENLDNVSPEQEERIKLALAMELGIPVTQVDWKAIYRARAENGDKKIALIQSELDKTNEAEDEFCSQENKDNWHRTWMKNNFAIEKLKRQIKNDK